MSEVVAVPKRFNSQWLLAVAFMGPLSLMAQAAGAAPSRLEATLTARLEKTFHGDIWNRKDAAGFVSEFYSDDALGTMEGAPTIWRGREAFTKLMTDVMKEYASIDFQVHSTTATGPGSAYQFVLLHAPASGKTAELKLKCLYVWKKGAKGWRVAADMCASGGMDP
jgi:ketosteroid isomerase-like protein